jgi:sulfur carrier protein ThiS
MTAGFVEVLFEGTLRRFEIKGPIYLKDLLEDLHINESSLYWFACNRKMILKTEIDQKVIEPGDRVEIFRILSGGSEG